MRPRSRELKLPLGRNLRRTRSCQFLLSRLVRSLKRGNTLPLRCRLTRLQSLHGEQPLVALRELEFLTFDAAARLTMPTLNKRLFVDKIPP